MLLHLNKDHLSDDTERYQNIGFPTDFLSEILKAVDSIKQTGNERYITRHGNARDIVMKMDVQDIKTFLRHYKDHK